MTHPLQVNCNFHLHLHSCRRRLFSRTTLCFFNFSSLPPLLKLLSHQRELIKLPSSNQNHPAGDRVAPAIEKDNVDPSSFGDANVGPYVPESEVKEYHR